MSNNEEDTNPYELLGVGSEATDADIKTAYRQRSLKVHPDRNRGNPDAARKFHELNQAYELLLDPLRRMALDAKQRIKESNKARYAQYDAKRKTMVDDLEERERAFKKSRVEKKEKEKQMWRDNEKIMEEGRVLREEREKEMRKRREAMSDQIHYPVSELEPPSVGALDSIVKVKWQLSSRPDLETPEALSTLLLPFGATESAEIVVSLKPAPPKRAKRGIALVPFKQIGDAFGAVGSSGNSARGLQDVEITWAEGKEPLLIEWLKKIGKLGSSTASLSDERTQVTQPRVGHSAPGTSIAGVDTAPSLFSSFPSAFDEASLSMPGVEAAAGNLDYESLTLMRLRQAERERLEREIREHEETEG